MTTEQTETSLYERVGGEFAVLAAVDLFYDRVMQDPLLSDFFRRLDMEQQARKMAAFMSWAFGGPAEYRGRALGEAHRGLLQRGLHDAHFDAILGHLRGTLDELGVEPSAIEEVMSTVEATRAAVFSRTP